MKQKDVSTALTALKCQRERIAGKLQWVKSAPGNGQCCMIAYNEGAYMHIIAYPAVAALADEVVARNPEYEDYGPDACAFFNDERATKREVLDIFDTVITRLENP